MDCHVNQRFSHNDSPLVRRSSVITRSESDEVIHKLCRIATDFSILKIFKSVYKNLKVFVNIVYIHEGDMQWNVKEKKIYLNVPVLQQNVKTVACVVSVLNTIEKPDKFPDAFSPKVRK